eukprot:363172-Chlamydomonas_euryale.AAC.3
MQVSKPDALGWRLPLQSPTMNGLQLHTHGGASINACPPSHVPPVPSLPPVTSNPVCSPQDPVPPHCHGHACLTLGWGWRCVPAQLRPALREG